VNRRACLSWPLCAAVLLVATGARAADPCMSAPVEGQKLQRAGKLLQALDRFGQCARNSCPREIVQDCTGWAEAVEHAVPSVVAAARDAQGRDLIDVQVAIDGQPAVPLTARAIELDPGPHHFVFSTAGNANVERDALLREGEKNREILATFGVVATAAVSPAPAPPPPADVETDRPVPLGAWIAGGVAVAAFGVFGVAGAIGVSERSSDGCGSASGCPASQKSGVDSLFRVADVGLGVGVVALGVATWLYLTRPSVAPGGSPSAAFDLRPQPGGAVATFGATF
jgi:hypothetical protein